MSTTSVMRSLLPKSLFGRNLLLFVAVILAAEIANGVVFRVLIQEPRAARIAEVAKLQIETARAALLLVPADQRASLMNRLAGGEEDKSPDRLAVSRTSTGGEQPAPLIEPRRAAMSIFMQHLRETLGPQYQAGWQAEPEHRLWVGTRIDDITYWFGIDSTVFVSNNATLFVVFCSAAALLAVLGATLIQRRINRPLHALAAAAAEIGQGRIQTIPLDNLTLEIAAVAHSFNRMAAQLDAAERERALMLAGVSHDLRTPLAKLSLAVAILADANEPELITGMQRNIAAADAIIGQFIDFARMGGDEAQQLCDINEIIGDVVRSAGKEKVAAAPGALPPIACRPLALRRAIANLVENALRYGTDEGSQGAEVSTSVEGNQIRIRVADHGPGIPLEQMERLRQPFTRADAARSKTAGSGLGLAIVERIARLHGGRLILANRTPQGLEASLLLPVQTES
jgi:two-component system osmolarity sensor histidine kinase EnvZ